MKMRLAGRLAVLLGLFVMATAEPSAAKSPQWGTGWLASWGANQPVRPRIDVIPPLGNHLPYSHAARLNRPAYWVGKTASVIEPSSHEAMAWERAKQRGHYANHAPRMVTHYLHPKPWEVLGVGPRPRPAEQQPEPSSPGLDRPALVQLASPWGSDETLTSEATSPASRLPAPPDSSTSPLELAPAIDLSDR